jgi:hypothetical protein
MKQKLIFAVIIAIITVVIIKLVPNDFRDIAFYLCGWWGGLIYGIKFPNL